MRRSCVLAFGLVAACGNSSNPLVTTAGSGTSTTSASSAGSSGTSTGSAATTSGSGSTGSSTGATSSSGSGTTSGTTGSGTTGTTGSGTTTSSSSSTTGTSGPPYQGFDAGPHPEPPIDVDSGCTARTPYWFDAGQFCVTCRLDADCPTGTYCGQEDIDIAFICYPCRPDADAGTVGCRPGEVCASPTFFPHCTPDCRLSAVNCTPGYCDPDAGVCLHNQCQKDADCNGFSDNGDGGGVCYLLGRPPYCVGCLPDGTGCSSGQLCNDVAACEANCLDGGGTCPAGSYCSSGSGLCTPGCQSNADCGGPYFPFCDLNLHPAACVACLTAADCPDWRPGCNPYNQTCGLCVSQSDCPTGLHCSLKGCTCTTDVQCAAHFPNQPVCIGLEDDGGSTEGACACSSSADCAVGSVCETRSPYQITSHDGLWNVFVGGVCIPSCVGQDAGYCAATVGLGLNYGALDNAFCNSDTGYCVPCTQDSDCAVNASQPIATPSCILFDGGNYPTGPNPTGYPNPPLLTGGGQCGCSSTAACDNGFACYNPSLPGDCQAPCTLVDGLDSCTALSGFEFSNGPYCNTFTGACQYCLDDYDCTGTLGGLTSLPAPLCDTAGLCVQCTQADQCPSDLPGCFQGQCGLCAVDADCPADAGLVCAPYQSGGTPRCIAPCVPGDDAGMGTVSDAGPSCPSAQPFCATPYGAPADAGWCSDCRGASDCSFFCCGTYCSPGYVGCLY